MDIWHKCLGHPNAHVLQHVFSSHLHKHVPPKLPFCKHCVQGKMTQLPFPHSTSTTHFPLELVHSDVWGPSPITSINGTRFFVIFVDDFSPFTWFFPLKHKSQVLSSFIHFKNTMETLLNTSIKILCTDCGSEYTKDGFTSFCSNLGIIHQFSCPHTSQKNGVAERKHRHIVDLSLTLISQSSLPLTYWPYAFSTSVYLINRLPFATRGFKSPWEVLFHHTPTYTLFKSFGCPCFPLLRPYSKHKLLPRSSECIFLGYASNSKGYLCLDPTTSRFHVSRHVIFDETTFPFRDITPPSSPTSTKSSPPNLWLSSLLFFTPRTHSLPSVLGPIPSLSSPSASPSSQPNLTTPTQPISPLIPSLLGPHPSTVGSGPSFLMTNNSPSFSITNSSPSDPSPLHPTFDTSSSPLPNQVVSPSPLPSFSSNLQIPSTSVSGPILNSHPMQTRAKSGISKKKAFPSVLTSIPTSDYLQTKPPNFTIASRFSEWCEAMDSEFAALQRQNTWSLVPSSSSTNVIGCRWVYKLKRHPDGSVAWYKARLVAKGFHQQAGLDYDETFSPVVKPPTVRIILSLAAHHRWSLRQLDVSKAFLHGFLKEDVFMQQPQGYVDSTHSAHVCKLHKSLYGLKQAPHAWFDRFTTHLLDLGFCASVADPSLFVFRRAGVVLYLLLYVDDIILTGNDSTAIITLISQLATVFELKDLSPLYYFLGLQVDSKAGGLFVH